MAKVKKTNVYPIVLPSLLDRLTITDVSDFERTKSILIAGLIEFINPGSQVLIDKIYSGSVYWTGVELIHKSTIIKYAIASQQYEAPRAEIALDDAHPTLNRIDVFAVTTDSELIAITGTPALNPQEPNIIFGEQLKVCIVYIPAASSTPQLASIEQIYDENAQEPDEWDSSKPPEVTDANVNFEGIENPDLNTKHIIVKSIKEETQFTFIKDTTTPVLNLSSLFFRLLNKTDIDFMFDLKFLNGADFIGSLAFSSGNFGFDVSDTENYQDVNIPIEMFQLMDSEFDTIIFGFSTIADNSGPNFFIDDIQLKYGGENPNVLQSYLSLTDTFDDNYTRKAGYMPVVNNQETGLKLKARHLHHIEDALVKKKAGNVNYDLIEPGDIVWMKEVTNDEADDETIVLMGDTYDAGGAGNLDKSIASSYIKINSLNV